MSVINIIKLMMASTLTCMVYACDFTEKNIDPNSPTSIEPGPLLTYTQLHTTTGGIAKTSGRNLHDACTASRFLK